MKNIEKLMREIEEKKRKKDMEECTFNPKINKEIKSFNILNTSNLNNKLTRNLQNNTGDTRNNFCYSMPVSGVNSSYNSNKVFQRLNNWKSKVKQK
jgi:predicted Mrr-cat superfamily restriction endonuclease